MDMQSLRVANAAVLDICSRAVAAFQASGSTFEVLFTLPAAAASQQASTLNASSLAPQSIHPIRPALPPASPPGTLIVLDSSFNPPSLAHMHMLVSAVHDLIPKNATPTHDARRSPTDLRVLLLLAVNNADKSPKPATFGKRLALMWAFAHDLHHTLGKTPERPPAAAAAVVFSPSPALAQSASWPCSQPAPFAPSIDLALTTVPYFYQKSLAIAASPFYHGHVHDSCSDQCTVATQAIIVGFDTLKRLFDTRYYGPEKQSDISPSVTSTFPTPLQQALGPFFARATLRVTLRPHDQWGSDREQLHYVETLRSPDRMEEAGGSKDWCSKITTSESASPGDGEGLISSTRAREAAVRRDWAALEEMVPPSVASCVQAWEPY